LFILKSAHEAITAQLNERIAELQKDRDFYRDLLLESKSLPSHISSTTSQFSDQRARPEAEPERIDANWSSDDRALFLNWCRDNVSEGTNPHEEWRRLYGDSPPLVALTV
jgi:hypothetical protein